MKERKVSFLVARDFWFTTSSSVIMQYVDYKAALIRAKRTYSQSTSVWQLLTVNTATRDLLEFLDALSDSDDEVISSLMECF